MFRKLKELFRRKPRMETFDYEVWLMQNKEDLIRYPPSTNPQVGDIDTILIEIIHCSAGYVGVYKVVEYV